MTRADERARVLAFMAQRQIPPTASEVAHATGVSEAILTKMVHDGTLERTDHDRRLRLRSNGAPTSSAPPRKPRPAWEAQKYSAAAAARRARGKKFPATMADLVRALEQSDIRPTRLPPGPAMVAWRPTWWSRESGMPELKPKPRARRGDLKGKVKPMALEEPCTSPTEK